MSDSPSAYNPKDRIKRHLKRKSSNRSLFSAPQASAPVFDLNTESCPTLSTASNQSNPFKVGSPLKKRRPPQNVVFSESVFDWDDSNAQDPFSGNLPSSSKISTTPSKSPRKNVGKSPAKPKRTSFARFKSMDAKEMLAECFPTDFSNLLGQPKVEVKKVEESSENVPVDFRLGSKLRISTSVPFPWMKNRKTTGKVPVRLTAADRYEGLKYFTRHFQPGSSGEKVDDPDSAQAFLEASALYYQFPVMPGLSLYPRISSMLESVKRIPMSPAVQDTMNQQWVEGFEQLFTSWKKGDRKMFYVASSAFNVLFTKTGAEDDIDIGEDSRSCFQTSGGQKMIALVTHTTSAVREAIRSEGVEYEVVGRMKRTASASNISALNISNNESNSGLMGNFENSCSALNKADEKEQEEKKEDGDVSDENESPTKANQQWLKEIGVSPRNVIKHMATRKLASRIGENADGISCLLVKGPSVQALYNMLQTSQLVHEVTGAYSRVPPTLIAEAPFLYAQMLSLTKTSHVVQKVGKTIEYVVELSGGPILPHSVNLAADFLRYGSLCSADKAACMQVGQRHACSGMNSWTERAQDWNSVDIYIDVVKWTK